MQFFLNFVKNNKGVSIISALVGSAIALIVVLGITEMINNVYRAQRGIRAADAGRDLIGQMIQVLRDPASCVATFGVAGVGAGQSPKVAGFAANTIFQAGPVARFTVGQQYINGLIQVTGFQLRNFTNYTTPTVGKSDLVITLSKVNPNNTVLGVIQTSETVTIYTVLDAADQVIQCYALGRADSLWQIDPNNANNIYYNAGNVGVGTISPQVRLDVSTPVNGNPVGFRIAGDNDVFALLTNYRNDSLPPTLFSARGRGTQAAPTALINGDSALAIAPQGWDGTGLQSGATMNFVVDNAISTNHVPMAITFITGTRSTPQASNDLVERMRITSSGNVGIGTNTPGALFSIHESSGNDTVQILTNSAHDKYLRIVNKNNSTQNYTMTLDGDSIKFNNDSTGISIMEIHPSSVVFRQNVDATGHTIYASAFNPSDLRLKKNIFSIDHALDKITQLTGVYFEWIDKNKYGKSRQIGLIAQDVEEVFPEVVVTKEDGMKAVNYAALLSPVIESIKELLQNFKNIFVELNKKSDEISALKSENETMKSQMKIYKMELEKIRDYLCSKDLQSDFCNPTLTSVSK